MSDIEILSQTTQQLALAVERLNQHASVIQQIQQTLFTLNQRVCSVEGKMSQILDALQLNKPKLARIQTSCQGQILDRQTGRSSTIKLKAGQQMEFVRMLPAGWCELKSPVQNSILKVPQAYVEVEGGLDEDIHQEEQQYLGPPQPEMVESTKLPYQPQQFQNAQQLESLTLSPQKLSSSENIAQSAGPVPPQQQSNSYTHAVRPSSIERRKYYLDKQSTDMSYKPRVFYIQNKMLCWYSQDNPGKVSQIPLNQMAGAELAGKTLTVRLEDGRTLRVRGEDARDLAVAAGL